MRFFFTQQAVQRLPKGFPGKARDLKKVGVDGADGFMGNAIAWLALEAGYDVVAHVPIEKFVPAVKEKLTAKYGRALKKGMSQADLEKKLGRVLVTTNVKDLQGCDLVIEARMENRDIKADFYRALGKGIGPDTLVASNSSSMGPPCSHRSSPRAAAARRTS
jgi:3-hydroxybutyryl-CoA dehydrogenase